MPRSRPVELLYSPTAALHVLIVLLTSSYRYRPPYVQADKELSCLLGLRSWVRGKHSHSHSHIFLISYSTSTRTSSREVSSPCRSLAAYTMAALNPAPEIPNLFTLRGPTRGRGPRRRGGPVRGGGPTHAPERLQSSISQAERDRLIQETDSDANVSRLSAVATGCLKDDFAEEFGACPPHQTQPTIRQPIINRGASFPSYPLAVCSNS